MCELHHVCNFDNFIGMNYIIVALMAILHVWQLRCELHPESYDDNFRGVISYTQIIFTIELNIP